MSDDIVTIQQNPALIAEKVLKDVAIIREIGVEDAKTWDEVQGKLCDSIENLAKMYKEANDLNLHLTARYEETLKKLREEAKNEPDKGFDEKKTNELIGKACKMIWQKTGNFFDLCEMGFFPQNHDNMAEWGERANYQWQKEKRQWIHFRGKDALSDANTGAFLLPDPLANVILRDAAFRSQMMGRVRNIPMSTGVISYPSNETVLTPYWYGPGYVHTYTKDSQVIGDPLELRAYVLTCLIPWLDTYISDAVGDIGQQMRLDFADMYAREFDTQAMSGNGNPFTGLLNAAGQSEQIIGSISPSGIVEDDLSNALQEVRQEEKIGASWFMHETVAAILRRVTDVNGNSIYLPGNGEGNPPRLLGYPVVEVSTMPPAETINPGDKFIEFCNPSHMIHGNRAGLEVRSFTDTTDSRDKGLNYMRWRKRDGFLAVQMKANVYGGTSVVIKTATS